MVMYKWDADEDSFAMPVQRGHAGPLADDSSDDQVAMDADAAEQG